MTQQFSCFGPPNAMAAQVGAEGYLPHARMTVGLPSRLIVDGLGLLKPFTQRLRSLTIRPSFLLDNTQMLNEMLISMAYERFAEMSIQYDVMQMVGEMLGDDWGVDIDEIAQATVEFGFGLFDLLRTNGAYHLGYLHYHHGVWMGTDIMLHRLEAPSLDERPHRLHPTTPSHRWQFGYPDTPKGPRSAFGDFVMPHGFMQDPSGIYTDTTEDPEAPVRFC